MPSTKGERRRTEVESAADAQGRAGPLAPSVWDAPKPLGRHLADAVGRVVDAGTEPVRSVFLARALNAVAHLAAELTDAELARAAGAQSDYAVLVDALENPAAIEAARAIDPLAEARLRGLRIRDRILQARGGVLTVGEVARTLGITRQAVDKRRRSGRLLALSTGRRGYAYPSWQFQAGHVVPGFEQALEQLAVRDPWMQAAFFLAGEPSLDGSAPIDALEQGDVAAVCRVARGYGEQTAL